MHLNKSRVEQRTLLLEKEEVQNLWKTCQRKKRKCARCVRKPPWVFIVMCSS